jgi:hypothetical protein
MMSLLLSSVSASALLGPVTPPAPSLTPVKLVADVSYTLTNEDKGFISNTTDGRRWAWSEKILGDQMPKAGFKGFYWEVTFTGASTADHNSYIGVMKTGSESTFVYPQDITRRGNGGKYINGAQNGTTATFTNADRLMFCFNPYTGEMWYGTNGTWHDDPATAAASSTGSSGVQFRVEVQSRFGGGSGGTLHSVPEDFAYEIPANAVALADTEVDVLEKLTVFGSHPFILYGASNVAATVLNHASFTVHGSKPDRLSATKATSYVILE